MIKVYGWMSSALAVTDFVAIYVASTTSLVEIIGEIFIVGAMVGCVQKMSVNTAHTSVNRNR